MDAIFSILILISDVKPPSWEIDAANTGLLRTLVPGGELHGAAFSRDGERLGVGVSGGVRLYDTRSWCPIRTLSWVHQGARSVAFSPDGKRIAAGGTQGIVGLWDGVTGDFLETLNGHSSGVLALAFSRDSRTLLSASSDGAVMKWTLEPVVSGQNLGASRPVVAVSFSRDLANVATACTDGTVRVWKIQGWEETLTLPKQAGEVAAVDFFGDGSHLALFGSGAPSVRIWDLRRGRLERDLAGPSEKVGAIRVSPNDAVVLGACGKELRLWNARTGKELGSLVHHTYPITSIAVHPFRRMFVTTGADRHLKVWGPLQGGMTKVRKKGFCGIQIGAAGGDPRAISLVYADSPAQRSGLRIGDVLKKVDGISVSDSTEMIDQISSHYEGDGIDLEIERDGQVKTIRVQLADRPASFDP